MENLISTILLICVAFFIYGMIKIKKLLAVGEVKSFNIMAKQNLSKESQSLKKQAMIGFFGFMSCILIMLILTSIYGPVYG